MGFIYGKNSDIDRKSGKQSESEKKNVSQENTALRIVPPHFL
jgi:hypothetical protein